MAPEDHRIKWYAGQAVLRQHTFQSRVLSAPSCTFDGRACLAVLEADRVTVYQQDGTVHSVALAARARVLWPMRCGVLIESAAPSAPAPVLPTASAMAPPPPPPPPAGEVSAERHSASSTRKAAAAYLERPVSW